MTSPTGISSGGGLTFMVQSRCRFTAKPFVPSGPAATTTERGIATPAWAQRGVRWQRDLNGLLAPSLGGQEGGGQLAPRRTRIDKTIQDKKDNDKEDKTNNDVSSIVE